MRKPATTPPVFDPRTINPNRVPTGLKVLIVASFMIAVGFGLVAPVLPNYAQNFNATVTMATMVVSALAITRLLFAPTAGKIITRFGERPVYTIGMLIVSVTSFMIAFAWDYWVLLAARAAAGIGSVMFTVSAMGLLVRLSPPHMRGRISGYYATAFLLGNLLGPVIASALAPFGLRAPFIVYGFSLLVAGLIVWFLMPSQATLEAERDAIAEAARLAEGKGTGTLPSEAPSPAFDSAERSETEANSPAQAIPPAEAQADASDKAAHPEASSGRSNLPAMTVRDALKFTNYRSALVSNWAIGWSVFGVQSSIIPLAAAYLATGGDMSNAVAGTLLASLAMATNSLGNALTQTFSGRFSDRFGRRVMAFSGLLLAGSAVTFMGFAPVAWVFVSLTACLGIGAAFMGPSIQAAVSDVIGTRRSGGQVLAVYQMCSDFGMILGPLVAGLIADAWGFVPAFVLSGLLLVAAAFTWAPFQKARWPKDIADADYTGR
ncbi:MFS transporter [uncultured Rothia sp.]|uniref:MFS transporter n=1 Tax=uncultured Rothia sp. TaxID=316088 RepID=UPI0028D46205|nr:MFS transporter [uncultured Rothia sp.]